MKSYFEFLPKTSEKDEHLLSLIESWVNINSHTENLEGLAEMLKELKTAFARFGGAMEEIPLPPCLKIDLKGNLVRMPLGNALKIIKNPEAPLKILLAGHMDTVFAKNSPFQRAERIDKNTMRGPGAADMKGGLAILLKILDTLENSPFAGKIGWEVLINPDEEIGSPGSAPLFVEAAARNHVGLIFEPSYPDGFLVSSRKGSANFAVVARGRGAHAGRDFHAGRNAIAAVARFVVEADKLNDPEKGITVNVGDIVGGGAINIVPDLSICRLNMRGNEKEEMESVKQRFVEIASEENRNGITMELHEIISRDPKPFDSKSIALFDELKACGDLLGIPVQWRPSGGVCDGNILSAAGLPTIDSLGGIGGNLHTVEEYLKLDSLNEKAALVSLFVMRLTDKGL